MCVRSKKKPAFWVSTAAPICLLWREEEMMTIYPPVSFPPLILPRPASEEEEEGRGTIKTLFPGSKKKDDSGAGNNTKSVDL